MRVKDIPGIDRLSASEKILLAEELWASITVNEADVPVPDGHLKELELGLDRHRADPRNLLTLEELRQWVQSGR